MDAVTLSRIQFAVSIGFHYIFPPLTIGLGVVLVWLEAWYLKTRDAIYETAARFWTKVFALNFAIGVATWIVMEFQFGTNWATYSRYVGDVFGSALLKRRYGVFQIGVCGHHDHRYFGREFFEVAQQRNARYARHTNIREQ